MSDSDAWPIESAKRVKFYVPEEYGVSKDNFIDRNDDNQIENDGLIARFQWDANQQLLKVVAVDRNDDVLSVLDVIDVHDMIGASIEIQLKDERQRQQPTVDTSRASNEPPTDRLSDTQASAVLHLYSYPKTDPSQLSWKHRWGLKSYRHPKRRPHYQRPTDTSNWGPRVASHKHYTLLPTEDLGDANRLRNWFMQQVNHRTTENKDSNDNSARHDRHYLIVVNPHAGPNRNGKALCDETIVPMLEQANITCDVFVSQYARHAQERMAVLQDNNDNEQEKDLSLYNGVIVVGGDGSTHETVNGIVERPDSEQLLPNLILGVIGCGSGNGFAKSVASESHEHFGIVDQCFLICKGRSLKTDLSRYQTRNNLYTSVLTFAWGFIADLDIESEKIRFVGEARFELWAVLRILFLRIYKGRFSYLPACKVDDKSRAITMPSITDPVPADWEVVDDDFVLFWASTVPYASATTKQSPNSHLQDGVFQIMIVRTGLSRIQMIRILLASDSGAHVNLPGVEFVDCVAYRLEPETPGSFNDIDGEVVEAGPIQGNILPRAISVFCNSHSYL